MKKSKRPVQNAQAGSGNKIRVGPPLVLGLAIILALAIIASGGYVLYRAQEQAGEQAVDRELAIVSRLKVEQITQWRSNTAIAIESLRKSPLLIKNTAALVNSPGNAELKSLVTAELAGILEVGAFRNIRLVDSSGKTLVDPIGPPTPSPERTLQDLPSALISHQTVWSGFYYSSINQSPQLDIIAPLLRAPNESASSQAALIFSINPAETLYPLIQSWPSTSSSSEVMLVALEDDQAVILNELRQQKGAAVKLKIPLNFALDPAVAAVQGTEGLFSGTDYRGVAVLAALEPIPNSPWYVTVKMDRSEILAGRNLVGTWAAGSALGVLIVSMGFLWIIGQRRQTRSYQSLYRQHSEEKSRLAHLEYMVKFANDIILICDSERRILQVNEYALQVYGYTGEELLGKTLESLITPETLSSCQTQLSGIRESDAVTAEVSFIRKNGSAIPVEISARLFKVDDRTCLQAIIRDIRERKEKEAEINQLNSSLEERVQERTSQLEAANKELESFAYSVSHDLRAPLRGIDGWSQALMDDYRDKLGDKGLQILGRIRSETQRMGQLIDDMLKFSRDTRGDLNRQEVDITGVVQTITSRLQQANPNRQIKFVVQQGLKVQGDTRLLEMALSNLLDNSVKFTSKTPQPLILFGEVFKEGKPVFFVHDNGVGFDMAYSQKLFKVFQRLHKASDYPGTGIGLATVQRIIHRHGGKIWAEAQVGQGATFYFTVKEPACRTNSS